MPCFIKPDMHHTRLCIVPCCCGGCLLCFLLLSGVCFFGLVPLTLWLWGLVRLRPFVFFMDSFFFLAGFQARWSYPRNHYYLCYASLLALLPCQCYDAYHLLSSLPNCHVKPLTHHVLANHCLAMLPLCLAPSYSVVNCRWRLELVPCLEHGYFVGISQYILFNKCIYILGKGWKARPLA